MLFFMLFFVKGKENRQWSDDSRQLVENNLQIYLIF